MSRIYELVCPCHFGLEAILKKEIIDLGYEVSKVSDGKVYFLGDAEAIVRANIGLRTTERVLICVAEFKATTYEELFQGIKAIDWDEFVPRNGRFWVSKATSVKSKLFSPSDIQSIVKKAMVEQLRGVYHTDWFKEDGSSYPLRVSFNKDIATVGLDTTGESLHRRGYRKLKVKAPITETLAAALIMLTPWNKDRILVDPFCGSGTFAIEAALMAANIAPGLNRSFLSESWTNLISASEWKDVRQEAKEYIDSSVEVDIQGYDIDEEAVNVARENAKVAGVLKHIHLQQRDVAKLSHPKSYGFIITNPPYGERLGDESDMPSIYRTLGERYKSLKDWSMYIITGYEDAQKYIGRKADKNRKIYNGMLKTYFYQYEGAKPPKRKQS